MKGNRKRGNVKKVKESEVKPVEIPVDDIVKHIDTKLRELCPVLGFSQQEANLFNTGGKLSTNIAQLKRQFIETESEIFNKKKFLKQVEDGYIKFPFMTQIGRYIVMVTDKNKFKQDTLAEIDEYEKAKQLTISQLRNNYNGYVDALNNIKAVIDEKLSHAPVNQPTISTHRGVTQKQDEERKLFEQKFNEIQKEEDLKNKKALEEIKQKAKTIVQEVK